MIIGPISNYTSSVFVKIYKKIHIKVKYNGYGDSIQKSLFFHV